MALIEMDFATGIGEHYEETVLWENSNPTSNQGEVTIDLLDSMSNYDYIKFVVRRSTSDTSVIEDIHSFADVQKSTGVNGTWHICLTSFVSGTGTYCRRIQYISDTSIKALTPYIVGGTASGVDATILIKVVGLKKVGGSGGKYTEVYVTLQNANSCIFKIQSDGSIDGDASDLNTYTNGEFMNGSYSNGTFTWTAKKNIKVKYCYGANVSDPNQVVYEQTLTAGQTVAIYPYTTALTMIVQEA